MTSSVVHTLLKTCLGAIVALVVSSMGLSTVAKAGCLGHYVKERSNSEKQSAAAFLELLQGTGALASSPEPTGDKPAPPPRCRGAFCSGQPSTPASPVPPSPSDSRQDWALPLLDLLLAPRISSAHEAAAPNSDPATPIVSIFHPPRA